MSIRLTALALALVTMAACADRPTAPVPPVASVAAAAPPFVFPDGCCFYAGGVVSTIVPPAASPRMGRDAFYAFPSAAAADQKGVVGVVPGDDGYHGGHWAFHAVTFNVTPYLLTSEAAVQAAEAAGDVTVTRIAANDFRCPIKP